MARPRDRLRFPSVLRVLNADRSDRKAKNACRTHRIVSRRRERRRKNAEKSLAGEAPTE